MGMFLDICNFCKAVFTDLGNLLDVDPKKKGPFIHNPDDKPTPWGADSYEPWDFLSEEQWEEIFRGDKPLEDFTMSHVWPPEKQEDNNIVEVEQENEQEQEQSEDSENTESSEADDSTSSDENLGAEGDAFESDGSFGEGDSGADCDSGDSGSYNGYIG